MQWFYVPTIEGATGIAMTAMIYTPTRGARGMAFTLAMLGGSLLFPQTASAMDIYVGSFSDLNLNTATCANGGGVNCSLRAAIRLANATPGKDIIHLNAGSFPLSIQGRDEDAAATGDLDITDDVDIIGNSGAATNADLNAYSQIDATIANDRVFHIPITANVTVKFQGLRITGGRTIDHNGAGILIENGIVTVNDCLIQNNTVDTATPPANATADFFTTLGGGIHVNYDDKTKKFGTLILENNSKVTSNTALAGGGISNQGTTNIRSNTFITGNFALLGGGGGIVNLGGDLNIGQASINGNTSNKGGGIYNEPQHGNSGSANIVGAAIENNIAKAINGIDPATGNPAEIGGLGAGIFNLGSMVVQRSAINDNYTQNADRTGVGADGGGLYNSAIGNIDIVNVTISRNTARSGGGIFTTRNLTLNNVTVFNNKALPCTLGGSCDARGATGGNELTVFNTNPGVPANNPDVVISSSILADDSDFSNASGNGVCAGTSGFMPYITSNGYNISGDTTCSLNASSDATTQTACTAAAHATCGLNATTDRYNLSNPALKINPALAYNDIFDTNGKTISAHTKTHQLLAGSPAIDPFSGNGQPPPCPLIDQRNMLRNNCDIGAYEYNAGTPAPNTYVDLKTTVTDQHDPATAGQQNTYTITVTNLYDSVDVDSVQVFITIPAQLTVNKLPTGCMYQTSYSLLCQLTTIPAQGKKQIYLDVTPLFAGSVTVTAEATVTSKNQVDAFPANNTGSQTTEIKGAADGSTNFGGTGGGGNIGALLWIAVAGGVWRRFSTKHH